MTKLVVGTEDGVFSLPHSEAVFQTRESGSAGTLRFTAPLTVPKIGEGSAVDFVKDQTGVFYGYVFSVEREGGSQVVFAYDQLRYLLYRDVKKFVNRTASEIIREIAAERKLKTGDIADTGLRLPLLIYDNGTLLDMISDALSKTAELTNTRYVFLDSYRRLTLLDPTAAALDLTLAPGAGILRYTLRSDIDTDTYNRVRLYSSSPSTGARETYVSENAEKVKTWGMLQYVEELTGSENEAQARARMSAILKDKCRKTVTAELYCIGDLRCRAGYSAVIRLPDEGFSARCRITDASHRFSDGIHTMNLTVKEETEE